MKQFSGIADKVASFLQNEFLCNRELWHTFVDVFRIQPDGEKRGWSGEYFGKMMRGACLVYEYTQNEKLYSTLTDSVCNILTVCEGDGRISSYSRETEFSGWDLWGRKYVMLGCEYYLDICKDEALKAKIIEFLRNCADYILEHIGPDKIKITDASGHWNGINSTSILEPMVRLYNLTEEQKYLDFASYIVDIGGAEGINIFELAYENKLPPYQYGVSKAYELTSCFEGLLEYYYATGIERYKIAVINYADAVLKTEMSIIGGSGCTHELFDHTTVRQTVKHEDVIQETCVTVTLMKLFSRMLSLTGESKYADAMERSFYNVYLGTVNTECRESAYVHNLYSDKEIKNCILPFDSYSPLTAGKRGRVVGGMQLLPNGGYYGCCACIGAAGVGVFLKNAVTVDNVGVTVNFYESGTVNLTYSGVPVRLEITTDYPANGKITIKLCADMPVAFSLRLRNPSWAKKSSGYTVYQKTWLNDTVEASFDMPIELHYPEKWTDDTIYTELMWNDKHCYVGPVKVRHSENDDRYFAVTRGPITFAIDTRTGKGADSKFQIPDKYSICKNEILSGVPCLIKIRVETKSGEKYYLVDYAHAGKDWKTQIAAWLSIE